MPSIEEYCEVRTEGGIYRDWLSVTIHQTFGMANTGLPRVFRLQVAEPDTRVLRLKPRDRVDIALAGQVVIREGYIKTRQVGYDGSRHGVQLDGYSKDGPITHASVLIDKDNGGEYNGYTFEQIARSVLGKHGLKIKIENPPEGADEPFRKVMVFDGERIEKFLERLARQRGLWLSSEEDGTITAGAGAKGGDANAVTLEEGVNILSATCLISMPEVDGMIGRSQQKGTDSLFGRKAAEISSKAEIPGGLKGFKRIILAEEPLSQKELNTRVNMEVAALERAEVQVNITHQGWLKPGGSELWKLREWVTVKSPMLFPTLDGQMELAVFGMTYSQDAGGTTTTLELVNKAAFLLKFTDASGNPNYTPPADGAKPEPQL